MSLATGVDKYRVKSFTLKVDDEDERTVTAQFATFDVIDHDGDLTERGAFGRQDVLMGAFNHNPSVLPPGKGYTSESDDAALFKGEFFQTASGDDHYATLKAAGGIMEWSYRFFIEDGGFEVRDEEEMFVIRKARVTHVAPVESGAGIGTQTLDIKSKDAPEIDYEKLAQAVAPDYGKLAGAVAAGVAQALAPAIIVPKGGSGSAGGPLDPVGADDPPSKGESLGALLRELRDAKELSNEDLSEGTGLSVGTIGQILGGTSIPSAAKLEKLAELLGVNLSRLVLAVEADAGTLEPDADDDPEDGKAGDGTTAKADDPPVGGDGGSKDDGNDGATSQTEEDAALSRDMDKLLSRIRGLPEDVDPAIAVVEQIDQYFGAKG